MKRWKSDSYSKQARDFADKLIRQCSDNDYQWALKVLSDSERSPLIVNRACKRFYRKFYKKVLDNKKIV